MSKSKIDAVSHNITKNLYLVHQTVAKSAPAKPVETSTNHIAVIDCSGSMTSDLPRIREQLKKKLPKLLRDGDTLSMVWFSGRGEFGALLEAEPVATLADLADVNKAIDRWLKPIGLTGFKEPLAEVEKLVGRVSKKNKNPFALFFMSDGCDNQWNRADILKVVEKTAGVLASSTFVEYGYYADRPLLAAMAEKAGGVHIHADAFDKYEVTFEAAMQKRPMGGKRIEVDVGGDPIGGFAFALADGEITTYDASTSKALVPENTTEIFYLSPTSVGDAVPPISSQSRRGVFGDDATPAAAAAYAAMSLFAVRMKPDVVYPVLKALGDVRFINAFSVCFGKQKYSEFMDAAKHAAFDPKLRCTEGYDPNKVPADDAFTVLDLLRTLADDDSTRLLLDHPDFKYSRIGRKRVDADENLTADEALQVEVIRNQMAGEKSAKRLKELQGELDTILAAKRDALKFAADEAPNGYEVSGLVFNECSPNISVRVRKTGKVDLSSRPEHKKFKGIPTEFQTHIWRNYSIVAHGLVNVEKLPVQVSQATYDALVAAGVSTSGAGHVGMQKGHVHTVINVKPLPIINRNMVKAVNAKDVIELEWSLLKARGAQKVYKAYQEELFPGVRHANFASKYGDDGAAWLKEQGLTDNGFSPKSVQAESKDFIMGKELDIKIKGCSKLDSVKAVKEKIKGGKKLNPCDTFMSNAIEEVDEFVKKNPKNLHEKWLTGQTQAQIAKTRGLIYQAAQIKFGILVGQVWFKEFSSLDENTLTVKIDGQEVVGVTELREVEIKI
jgi:hypothetical protein